MCKTTNHTPDSSTFRVTVHTQNKRYFQNVFVNTRTAIPKNQV